MKQIWGGSNAKQFRNKDIPSIHLWFSLLAMGTLRISGAHELISLRLQIGRWWLKATVVIHSFAPLSR